MTAFRLEDLYFELTREDVALFLTGIKLGGYYYYHYYYNYYYYYYVSCHRPILPGNSLEPTVIPTAQASSFTLQYFPYYV